MTDLESQIEASVRGVTELRSSLAAMTEQNAMLIRVNSRLEAENAVLRDQVRAVAAKADYHLRWNAELVTQANNIGMFVQDAMAKARIGPYRGNGQTERQALEAVAAAVELEVLDADPKEPVPKFLTRPHDDADTIGKRRQYTSASEQQEANAAYDAVATPRRAAPKDAE